MRNDLGLPLPSCRHFLPWKGISWKVYKKMGEDTEHKEEMRRIEAERIRMLEVEGMKAPHSGSALLGLILEQILEQFKDIELKSVKSDDQKRLRFV